MAAANSLDLQSDPRSIIGIREFDAPRELVFSLWTDPKHLVQWWGPNGFSTTTSRFEFRPGGVWRFVMRGPDGRDYQNRITFEEIVPPQRIVYRHGGGDDVEPVAVPPNGDFRGSRRPHAHHLARRVPVGGGTQSRHQGLRRRQRLGRDACPAWRLCGSDSSNVIKKMTRRFRKH